MQLITIYSRSVYLFIFLMTFFVVHAFAQPTINSFNPKYGPLGTSVAIIGSNFSTVPAENIVYFGAVKALVTAASATSLTVTVPFGTTYQPISITVNGLTAYSIQAFNVTFTGLEYLLGPLSFTEANNIGPANVAFDISIADFDGDGKPDVATANGGFTNNISVFRNTNPDSTVSFDPPVNFDTEQGPSTVTTGDIDGDGKIDIVVMNQNATGTFSVLRNNCTTGNISFEPKVNFNVSFPITAFISDLDGDGKPEVAVIGVMNELSIFKNTGTPGNISFDAPITISTNNNPGHIFIADLNNDHKPEVIVGNMNNGNAGTVSIYRNISTVGSILLDTKIDFPTANQPAGIAIGDLDGDDKPDMAIANNATATSSVSVFKNQSTGANILFAPKQDYPVVFSPESVSISDLNGDGKPDLAVANYNTKISVFQNNSSLGVITLGPRNDFLSNAGGYAHIKIGDLNADKKPDIAIAGSGAVAVFRNRLSEPNINFFSPNNGYIGTNVTITGTNFTGTTAVYFGAYNAQSFTVQSPTIIHAIVGAGGTGNVSVTNGYGTGTKAGFTYNYPMEVNFCTPPTGSSSLLSNVEGSSYQWQLSTDSVVYNNITNGGYYSNVNTRFLGINNIPSSFYGHRYRCLVDGSYSTIQTIRFTNTWIGGASNAWENPANWNCGLVPDNNTSVTISSGSVILNSNVTIRNLTLNPGVILTIAPGFNLTVTH
jgi:FG-GAP-like repeat/IPT/TIG domain